MFRSFGYTNTANFSMLKLMPIRIKLSFPSGPMRIISISVEVYATFTFTYQVLVHCAERSSISVSVTLKYF